MHFCITVLTNEFPTNEVLEKKLNPYYEEDYWNREEEDRGERPDFLWDYWLIGGRYGGLLKLKYDQNDETYRWSFYQKESRAGRLFRSDFLEQCIKSKLGSFHFYEEDYFGYMGRRDGYIYVDGCKASDAINFNEIVDQTYGFIGLDDKMLLRRHDDGFKFIDNDLYEEQVKEAVKDIDLEKCWITFVDCHT